MVGSLRSNFIALTVVAVVPVLGLATYLSVAQNRAQQEAVERGLDDTTSALVTSVDRELSSSITTLQALAASRRLDASDLPGFHDEARRVLETQAESGWLTVQLAAPDGTPLMHTLVAPGAAAPPDPDLPSIRATVTAATPTVSNLFTGPINGQAMFGIRVPVIRGGAVRYVLTAS